MGRAVNHNQQSVASTRAAKSKRALEVYGWEAFVRVSGRPLQCRVITAAASFAAATRAAEAAGVSAPHRDYFSTSGNEVDLATALPVPGTVFAHDEHNREYRQVVAGNIS